MTLGDLGSGARLLVPNGLSFGALQWKRGGGFHDWVRESPDRHQVPGSRHAMHLGVDLAFYVRRGMVRMLPEGLPIRSPADGVVAATHAAGTAELAPGGIILLHGSDAAAVRPFTYLGDVRDVKRPGDTVGAGDIVAYTLLQRPRRATPKVLIHLGVGLSIPGHGLEFLDPSMLLSRWKVHHPVYPGSTCTPEKFREAWPGTWRGSGKIVEEVPGPPWNRAWRSRY